MKRVLLLILAIILTLSTVTSCRCNHRYVEQDGITVCEKCDSACNHSYVDALCSVCGSGCPHSFDIAEDGSYCTVCNYQCLHSFAKDENGSTVCSVCGIVCEHSYTTDGTEKVCSVCNDRVLFINLDNVEDYISLTLEYDCGGYNEVYGGMGYLVYDIIVTAASSRDAVYDNVTLTYTLVPHTKEWNKKADLKMTLDARGNGTYVATVSSDLGVDKNCNPAFDILITDVCGEVRAAR